MEPDQRISDKPTIIFMGSPEMAVPALKGLIEAGEKIVAVVSQADRPAGRGQQRHSPAVATFAEQHSLPLLQPEKINESVFLQKIRSFAPDLVVVVAYGKILPKELLEIPSQCINLHFSLLPKYRGAAPVQWALINGEEETGVTTLLMTEKLDAGPILLQKKVMIEPDETVEVLQRRLANIGAGLLQETIDRLRQGDLHPTPQLESEVTQAPSLKKEDGRLNFKNKAKIVSQQIRGMNPWPGTYTLLNGKIFKIHKAEQVSRKTAAAPGEIITTGPLGIEVACESETVLLKEVQLEGKKRMTAGEFVKGYPLETGMKLG